jgi:hypothetical protein
MDKANPFVEPRDSLSRSAKYPSHSAVITHNCANKGAADALMTVLFGDNQHRYVAIRHSIGEGTQEPYDFAVLYRYQSSLGPRYQFSKIVRIRNTM